MSEHRLRAVGLITEYNPFHNGHLHHLRESLNVTGSQVSVAVMSGHFLQRGEPALVDKWVRTRMALAAGVDVVVELPFPWACSSARDFALGAVSALDALGAVDSLCFGSESGSLETLRNCAKLLESHGDVVAERTEALLRSGVNYPQARAQVFTALADGLDADALASPNNILGIEYLGALSSLGSAIEPFTIARIGAGFHEIDAGSDGVASATGIRHRLAEGVDVNPFIPQAVARLLAHSLAQGAGADEARYFQLLLGQIFRGPEALRRIALVANGMENRLVHAAEGAADLNDLITRIKSRQFTRTRIQRLLVYLLHDLESRQRSELLAAGPRYLHLLGVGERGRSFLATCRKQLKLPLVGNFSRIYATLKRFYAARSDDYRLAMRQLDFQRRATANYTLLMRRWERKSRYRDFYEKIQGVEALRKSD